MPSRIFSWPSPIVYLHFSRTLDYWPLLRWAICRDSLSSKNLSILFLQSGIRTALGSWLVSRLLKLRIDSQTGPHMDLTQIERIEHLRFGSFQRASRRIEAPTEIEYRSKKARNFIPRPIIISAFACLTLHSIMLYLKNYTNETHLNG